MEKLVRRDGISGACRYMFKKVCSKKELFETDWCRRFDCRSKRVRLKRKLFETDRCRRFACQGPKGALLLSEIGISFEKMRLL